MLYEHFRWTELNSSVWLVADMFIEYYCSLIPVKLSLWYTVNDCAGNYKFYTPLHSWPGHTY